MHGVGVRLKRALLCMGVRLKGSWNMNTAVHEVVGAIN